MFTKPSAAAFVPSKRIARSSAPSSTMAIRLPWTRNVTSLVTAVSSLVSGLNGHAELARELVKRLVPGQRILKPRNQSRRKPGVRAELHGGRNLDVADRLDAGVGVEQAGRCQHVQERGVLIGGHAAELHIGAVAEIEVAVAEARGSARERFELHQRQPAEMQPDADDKPVAGLERLERAGAPANNKVATVFHIKSAS